MNRQRQIVHNIATDSLADILERVLDKGIVIAGDIKINLADVELLTIRIRLLVCSVDKAQELGITWWQGDPFYSGRMSGILGAASAPAAGADARDEEMEALRRRIETLESQPRRTTPEEAAT